METLKFIFAMLLSVVSALSAPIAHAASDEYEVKAAFIHNIAQFIEWPNGAGRGSLRLCLLGQAPFDGALDALEGKTVNGRAWEFVALTASTETRTCHVLFISASEKNRLSTVLGHIKNAPVLTVADSEGFAARGVMVNFYLEQNRVRFEINQAAAQRANLKISSQLLKLARIVVESGEVR